VTKSISQDDVLTHLHLDVAHRFLFLDNGVVLAFVSIEATTNYYIDRSFCICFH
jgi:hypothetical protein